MENAFKLRPNLLLGVASSATQVDGGRLDHNWNDWTLQGRVKDGADPAVAAGHWERWREDALLLRRLGIQTYRFGVEWARVEPREGEFDAEALDHIKEELMFLMALGIRPLITLQHFTAPMWFEAKGGWEEAENIRSFLIYVEAVLRALGHLATEYITFDEANTYAFNGYIAGVWPPGVKSPARAFNVMSNMASAHLKAYRLIHDMRRSMGFRDTKVSFANQQRVFAPKNESNPLHRANALQAERLWQDALNRAMATGEFKRPLKNVGRDRRGSYCDFHAVNYYTRTVVGLNSSVREEGYKSDLGWEIAPQGLAECCKKLYELLPLPIYVTANGVCDLTDSFRARFLYEHLRVLCESRLPVKRYYYSDFMDGFAWREGGYARFGLVGVNGESMERTVKPSGDFYAAVIQNGGVTEELYGQYVADESYHY